MTKNTAYTGVSAETAYLLGSPKNAARLRAAREEIEREVRRARRQHPRRSRHSTSSV